MDLLFERKFYIDHVHLDAHGRCKPSILLYFAQEAAEQHCLLLKADWQTLQDKGLFWAVIRQKVQVSRLPELGETITVQTWPMPTTKVAYPRSTVAYDEAGNEVFRAISLWVLMDVASRAMILPGKSGIAVPGSLRGNELASPGKLLPQIMEKQVMRTVYFSQLDRNGHMNNTCYLDWLMDLLPSAFHKENPVQEFTVCYLSEAREGEEISLCWDINGEKILTVDAHRPDVPGKKQNVFCAQVKF